MGNRIQVFVDGYTPPAIDVTDHSYSTGNAGLVVKKEALTFGILMSRKLIIIILKPIVPSIIIHRSVGTPVTRTGWSISKVNTIFSIRMEAHGPMPSARIC